MPTILICISVKWILDLIMPFWMPVQDHNSGLPCAALQQKWLYSMCKQAEYIPAQAAQSSYTVSQLSSERKMHCGCTLLLLRLLSRQKKKKKKPVWGKCGVDRIFPDAGCVRTWLLCFSVHRLRPFIKPVMMELGLCCQPSKWSVTQSVSEPWTCTHNCSTNVYLIFLGVYFVFSWRLGQTLMKVECSFVGK